MSSEFYKGTKTYNDLLKTLQEFIDHKNEIIEFYKKDNNPKILYTNVHLSWYLNLIDLLTNTLQLFDKGTCISCTIRRSFENDK